SVRGAVPPRLATPFRRVLRARLGSPQRVRHRCDDRLSARRVAPDEGGPAAASRVGLVGTARDRPGRAHRRRRGGDRMSPEPRHLGLPGLIKGLATTARTLSRPTHTAEYPDTKPALPPRSRGVIALTEENCTSCMLCARECPDWCI